MALYRELGDGSLSEVGTLYREASDGSLVEIGSAYRELADGSLVQFFGPAFIGTLLPTSDVSAGGWTDSGGGDGDGEVWDEIDEDPHDGNTTYVSFTVVGTDSTSGSFRVHLSNPGDDPSGLETQEVFAVVRGEGEEAGSRSVDLALYEGTTLIADRTSLSVPYQSYGEASMQLTQSEKDAISNYDDLRVEVTGNGSATGEFQSVSIRCTQVRMEFSE